MSEWHRARDEIITLNASRDSNSNFKRFITLSVARLFTFLNLLQKACEDKITEGSNVFALLLRLIKSQYDMSKLDLLDYQQHKIKIYPVLNTIIKYKYLESFIKI